MTALRKYQKLESPGLWRPAPDAQRREVVVSFGDASLVIADLRSGTALAHWSLAAVDRVGPAGRPALYAPGREAHETLEIEDDTMVAAIDKVRGVIHARRRADGRLRRAASWLVAAVVVAGAALWLPGAIIRHTATVLPTATRDEIGARVMSEVARLHGLPCDAPLGRRALDLLTAQVLPGARVRIEVLPEGPAPATHLPGARILLSRALVEDADGPGLAAGHILAQRLAAADRDPILPVLHHAGALATFRLLTTGELPPEALDGYAAALFEIAIPVPDPDNLLSAMDAAGVPAAPYAYSRDPSGETTLSLIEGDPFRSAPAPSLLSDGDWVSLQGICDG